MRRPIRRPRSQRGRAQARTSMPVRTLGAFPVARVADAPRRVVLRCPSRVWPRVDCGKEGWPRSIDGARSIYRAGRSKVQWVGRIPMRRLAMISATTLFVFLVSSGAPGRPLAADESAGQKLVACTMTFNLKGWSAFYKTAKGDGTIRCDNGQKARVTIKAT